MNNKNNYIEIAQQTLNIEASTLSTAASKLDSTIEKAVEMIAESNGKLVITGVGKSGLIGAKMAATFASTGTPSFFLHPTEALHGDLGMIDSADVVLAISYSGESEELSNILPHIRRFKTPIIGMSRNQDSTLATHSDVHILLNVEQEACPLGVAPTSSTTLTLALGDALAVCLMHKREFKKDDFASFHPGGSLGKQLYVRVQDLMRTDDLPIGSDECTMRSALVKITEGRLGNLLLVDEFGRLTGMVSDGDVRRALMGDDFSLDDNAIKYANKEPKVISDASMLASEALTIIETYKIQMLAVVDTSKRVLGVLHIHDLVEAGIK